MSQEWSLTPQQQPAQRPVRGRGLIWTGAVLLVLSVVVGIAGVVGIGRGVGNLASGTTEPVVTPAVFSAELEAGRSYTVYEAPPFGSVPTVGPGGVSVTATDGSAVAVTGVGSMTQTFESGGTSFVAVARFVAPATGTYLVEVPAPGTTVMLGPSLSDLMGLGAWGIAIAVAMLLGLLGLVLLIVGVVMRASSRKAVPAYGAAGYGAAQPYAQPYAQPSQPAQPSVQPSQPYAEPAQPALPPAGWYPDPSRPGGQRWWDGSQWTEHQA